MAQIQITINDATERIYVIAEVEELFSQIENLSTDLKRANAEIQTLKTERRILYNDVKKIHDIIPMDGKSVNLAKLPRIINQLTNNPQTVQAFTGITKFVTDYEKNNLIVK